MREKEVTANDDLKDASPAESQASNSTADGPQLSDLYYAVLSPQFKAKLAMRSVNKDKSSQQRTKTRPSYNS